MLVLASRLLCSEDSNYAFQKEGLPGDVHSDGNTPLRGAANIVARPRDSLRYVCVDASDCQNGPRVFDLWVDGRNIHDYTDESQAEESDHKDTAAAQAITDIAPADRENARYDVGRHSHQLGGLVLVP